MISFAIPYEVPSQNVRERWHWRRQRREVASCADLVRYFAHAAGVADATGPRRLKITSYRRRLITDRANLVGGCKGLVDGLVRARVLVDDRDQLAELEYEQRVLSQLPPELLTNGLRKPKTVVEVISCL